MKNSEARRTKSLVEGELDPMTFLVAEALFESAAFEGSERKVAAEECWDSTKEIIGPAVCLVMLAHGSRDPRWCAPFEKLKHELVEERGPNQIRLAYMEFVGPTLMEVAARCAELDILRIRLLPLFMAAGAHLATDIPRLVQEVHTKFPALEIEILAPVGEDPRMARLLKQIVSEMFSFTQQASDFRAVPRTQHRPLARRGHQRTDVRLHTPRGNEDRE